MMFLLVFGQWWPSWNGQDWPKSRRDTHWLCFGHHIQLASPPVWVVCVSEHHTCCQSPKICYPIDSLFTCWQYQTSISKWHVGELSLRAFVCPFLSNQKYFGKLINWTNCGRSWFCAFKSAGICDWFLCHCVGNIHDWNRFEIIFCKPSHPWLSIIILCSVVADEIVP